MDRRRDGFFELRQHGFDLIHDLHGVGAGGAEDEQQFGPLAVEPRAGARIDRGINDIPEVAELHGCAVLIGNNDVVELTRVGKLIVGVEGKLLLWALKVAFGGIERRVGQRSLDLRHAQSARGQRARIDLHSHGRQLLSGNQHLAHAGNRRQRFRKHRIGVGIELIFRHGVGMDGIDEDRSIRRVGLAIGRRRRQVLGQ